MTSATRIGLPLPAGVDLDRETVISGRRDIFEFPLEVSGCPVSAYPAAA